MGQQEVIDCLKKNNRPMSRTEIAEEIGCGKCRVSVILNVLLKFSEISITEIDRVRAMEMFGVKRRMRLYCSVD